MSCQVTVAQGILQGKECKTHEGKIYYSFEGIPYAKPPIGELRFKAPQPPEPWSGIWDATKPGDKCTQIDPYSNKSLDGSEDCLYLNVYTPVLPHEKIQKLPVVFFVHGGRFVFGYGHYYQPDFFIRHDVILVTINYRLSALGFLCLNIPEVPGNAALKDTVMALKWIHNNIEKFNGDFNNVTAFGESAGGGIVASYITTDMTDGLYHRVVAQSAVVYSDLYIINEDPIEKAQALTLALGQELTDTREIYNFLLKVPVEELIFAAASLEVGRHSAIINSFFLPVIERQFECVENFYNENPSAVIREGRFKKVPIIVGLNTQEAAMFIRKNEDGGIIYETNLQYMIPRYLNIKHDTPRALKFVKKLKSFYFEGRDVDGNTKLLDYLNFTSDAYFNRDILLFAAYVAKYHNDIYFYNFDYNGNINTSVMKKLGVKGATHGDMVQYQFYVKRKFQKCSKKDLEIADCLSEIWCNFAKTGKPTWASRNIEWLPYSNSKKYCLVIDEETKVLPYKHWDRIQFWYHTMYGSSKL